MPLDELLDQLSNIAPPSSPEDAAELESGLEKLAPSVQTLSDDQIDRVFRLLSDSSPYQDVLWSVLHLLETLGNAKYVDAYARNVCGLAENGAAEWADTIVCRIMNGDLEGDLVSAVQRHGSLAAIKAVLKPVTTAKGSIATKAAALLQRLEDVEADPA